MTVSASGLFQNDYTAAIEHVQDCLRTDQHALRAETQAALVALLHNAGRMLVFGGQPELTALSQQLVVDAVRHAGNRLLAETTEIAASASRWQEDRHDEDEHFYAEDVACNFVDNLQAGWYIKTTARAYRAVFDEVDADLEALDREIAAFEEIRKSYENTVRNTPNAMSALRWVREHTRYISNYRAMLPVGCWWPWWLE